MSQSSQGELLFAGFRIPAKVDLLYRGEEMVALERRAVQVLRYLAEHGDRVVTKDELLEAVWPDTFTTDGVLKRAVSQARRALGDVADQCRFIETYHGQGYRFIAAVKRPASQSAPAAPPAENAGPPAGTGTAAAPAPTPAVAIIPLPAPPQLAAPPRASAFEQASMRPFQTGNGVVGVPDYNQLVGREAELRQLQTEYARVLAGNGRSVMIFGEPGVGKTQLARAFVRWAQGQGALCLSARFFDYQASRLAPYEIFLDLLRTALGMPTAGSPESALPNALSDLRGLAQQQLGVNLPEELFTDPKLDARLGKNSGTLSTGTLAVPGEPGYGLPRTGTLGPRPQTTGPLINTNSRTVVALSQCFIRASLHRPLVLVFDDLQWADEASRDCVAHLLRTLQSEPLMIVCLARAEAANDRHHPLSDWLKRQASLRSYTALTLAPLSENDCRSACEAVFSASLPIPAADLQRLYRVTSGNPYFLTEMLRLLVAESVVTFNAAQSTWEWHGIRDLHLPDTVVMVARAKLDRLNDEVRELVECAAVIGDEFRIETLARMMTRGEEEIENLLLLGVRAGVLSERGVSTGNDARFYHTILRHVLYENLPPRRRKRLHLQAAQALENVYRRDRERIAEALSVHYEAAGDAARTFEWSLRAWQAASSRQSWSEAMSNIERARLAADELQRLGDAPLAQAERLSLLFAWGETCYATGRLQEAERAYSEAVALANTAHDRSALAVALLQHGQTQMGLAQYREARLLTEQALELYRQLNDAEGVALAMLQLGGIEVQLGHYEAAAQFAQDALEGVALNSQIAAVAFGLLGWARALQGHYAEGVPLLERAVDYMGNIGDVQRRALLLRRRHWAELARGRYESAIELAARARDDFRSVGDARGEAQMDLGIGQARLAQGLYDEALELLKRAQESLHRVGDTHLEAEAQWLLGRAHSEMGQYQTAEKLLTGALATIRESVGDRDDEFRMLTELARLRLATGASDTALALANEAVAIADELHNLDGLGLALIEQAWAQWTLKDSALALSTLRRGLSLLEETGAGERWRAYQALSLWLEQSPEEQSQREALAALRTCVTLLAEFRDQLPAEEPVRRASFLRSRSFWAQKLCTQLRQQGLAAEAETLAREWRLNGG
jgi:DNA-binding winged helix-turn-helix (wHTH) protein/tetratricopeptide (TPR) repeat protein